MHGRILKPLHDKSLAMRWLHMRKCVWLSLEYIYLCISTYILLVLTSKKNYIEDKKHEIDDKLYARWMITKSLPLHHIYTNLTPFVQMF